ncbi:transposable element Tc1 transposase [Trichonephila clavipes]|nr:transposable element Tc1 transposase [Trichonephila clavipes]
MKKKATNRNHSLGIRFAIQLGRISNEKKETIRLFETQRVLIKLKKEVYARISEVVKFEQISEFERGRIVGLREAGLSYRAVAARVQRNSSTNMRVSKQWTDEVRTARKSRSGPRNVTSAREDRCLVRMAQTDHTPSSR